MEFPRVQKRPPLINLVPLIDVSLFLLIFFMVAGSIEKFDVLPIDPPIAESGKMMDEGHITILLGRLEEVVMNDELITFDTLQAKVAEQLNDNPNKVITIKADSEIPASRMIAVMDKLKAAGAKNVSLATQSKK